MAGGKESVDDRGIGKVKAGSVEEYDRRRG